MKTRIGNDLYITHFFYSEPKTRGVVAIDRKISTRTIGAASTAMLKAELKRRRDNKLNTLKPLPRTTLCIIKKATSDTESKEIVRATAKNITSDPFTRGLGRKQSFLKALDRLVANGSLSAEDRVEFEASFYAQCPSSVEKKVEPKVKKEFKLAAKVWS